MTKIEIAQNQYPVNVSIDLPASKSIANRALIINALSDSPASIHNLSKARDTQTMARLLNSSDEVLDVIDAGTTMRFLVAYLAITNKTKILTGTPRMCERPIKILVDALKELGASVDYEGKSGYPPLRIKGFTDRQKTELNIQGNVSSQYISAVLMIAPLLQNGLKLNLIGKISSKPYIDMTLEVMEFYGAEIRWEGNSIHVTSGKYQTHDYWVEPDWSAASYWYSIVSLSKQMEVFLKDLKKDSLQGDRVISDIMILLGVKTEFTDGGAYLKKTEHRTSIEVDFTDCPDLAQTVAVICAAKGIKGVFRGLESLKIKETDRVSALQIELKKINTLLEESNGYWTLTPGYTNESRYAFHSYDDHRMAMAFAPLAMVASIEIDTPEVVNKSYPGYWNDYKKAGFLLKKM
ncbi:MAG: 3-phosphoshikimate 1-carboxyvinyltransferase [Bacteroidota bacterium]